MYRVARRLDLLRPASRPQTPRVNRRSSVGRRVPTLAQKTAQSAKISSVKAHFNFLAKTHFSIRLNVGSVFMDR